MKNKALLSLLCGILLLGLLTGCLNNSNNKENINSVENETNNNKYFLKINNKKIYFPCKVSDLLVSNLEVTDEDEVLVKNSNREFVTISLVNQEGNLVFYALVEPGDKKLESLTAIGFSLLPHDVEGYDLSFNGLVRNESTIDDVLEMFGQPETPEEIDKTLYINAFVYHINKSRLFVDFQENKLIAVRYIGR